MITPEIETIVEAETFVDTQRETPGSLMAGIIVEAGEETKIMIEVSSPTLTIITGAIIITTTQLDRDHNIIITDTVSHSISRKTGDSMMVPDSPDTKNRADTMRRTDITHNTDRIDISKHRWTEIISTDLHRIMKGISSVRLFIRLTVRVASLTDYPLYFNYLAW